MSEERTVYAHLSDEEIDNRADYKIDVSTGWFAYGLYVKHRFLWFSWWSLVDEKNDIERLLEALQVRIQLPRRYRRKVQERPQ